MYVHCLLLLWLCFFCALIRAGGAADFCRRTTRKRSIHQHAQLILMCSLVYVSHRSIDFTGWVARCPYFQAVIVDSHPCMISPRAVGCTNHSPPCPRLPAGICAAVVVDVMQMTDYYTHMVCTPARASLMTGRYVVRYGMQYNIIDTGATWGLPLTEKVRLCRRGMGVSRAK